jgi:hypothetical protein
LDRIEFDGVTDMTVTEGMSEAEESSYFQNRAIEWATDNPLDLLKLVAAKGVVTLLPIARAFESLPKALLLFVTAIPFYVGSVIQAVRYRSPAQWLLIGIIAQAVVVNLVTLPYTRTLSPVFPILILMGCALFVAHRPKRHSTGIDADSDINSNSSPINHGTRRPPVQ